MVIYYNPRCSKCREAKSLLEENKCDFSIREYLKDPPTKKELKELIDKLDCTPIELVRKSESLYINEYKGKKITASQWIKILCENPVLIERPIVIDGKRAIVGRPPALVVDFVNQK